MYPEQVLESFLEQLANKQLVVYSASAGSINMSDTCIRLQPDFIFCDSNPKKWSQELGGGTFLGRTVISPERLLEIKDTVVVLVSSKTYENEIMGFLKESGFTDNIFSPRILSLIEQQECGHYSNLYPEGLHLYHEVLKKSIHLINTHTDKINTVTEMLVDDESKFVYKKVINNRKYGIGNFTDVCDLEHNSYFIDDFFAFNDNEIFIDAGVFDGETTIEFIKKMNGKFSKVYCFEPDKINFLRSSIALERWCIKFIATVES